MTPGSSFGFTRRAVVAFTLLALPVLSQAADTCGLQRPPVAAGINAAHGSYFFVFPRTIDSATPDANRCGTSVATESQRFGS